MEKLVSGDSIKITEVEKTPKRLTSKEKLAAASKLKGSYCRHCNKMKPYSAFKVTTNPFIDKNGYMSICSDCLTKILNELVKTYEDYQKAFYAFCQNIDIIYDPLRVSEAIDSYKNHQNNESLVTKYWRAVNMNYKNKPIRYRDTKSDIVVEESIEKSKKITSSKKELRETWGDFTDAEYLYLETTYNEYSEFFGVNGPNERDGYRTLALLLLRQKANPENKDITAAIKSQYEMLGIDPKQLRKEAKDQGAMTLGLTISQMELTDPADFFNDPEMFDDVEGLQKDVNSIIRATKNFLIEGNNDFSEEDIDMNQIYDSTIEKDESDT